MRRTVTVVVASLFLVTGVAAVGVPAGGHDEFGVASDAPNPGEFSYRPLTVDVLQQAGSSATATNDAGETDGTTGVSISRGDGTTDRLNVTFAKTREEAMVPANTTNGTDGEDVEIAVPDVSSGTDTDGDNLPGRMEVKLGTDPTDADTDQDGIGDRRELVLGTDPIDADTDGDRLLDSWEVKGATSAGLPLPESDPLAKDLYVQVDYTHGVDKPDQALYNDVTAEFDALSVENPDNSTGIDLHVREGGPINESVRFDGENFWSLKSAYYGDRLGSRAGVYHHVVVDEFDTDYAGYGEVGGEFAMVAAGTDPETQRRVVVHELLHNVVGEVEGPDACHGGKHYCAGGWLSPKIEHGGSEYLAEPVVTQLEDRGFADE